MVVTGEMEDGICENEGQVIVTNLLVFAGSECAMIYRIYARWESDSMAEGRF